jgi:hypothetical protein
VKDISNDWDRKADEIRTAMRAIIAALHPTTDMAQVPFYNRDRMLEALIMLERTCTHMEGYGQAYRMYAPVSVHEDAK